MIQPKEKIISNINIFIGLEYTLTKAIEYEYYYRYIFINEENKKIEILLITCDIIKKNSNYKIKLNNEVLEEVNNKNHPTFLVYFNKNESITYIADLSYLTKVFYFMNKQGYTTINTILYDINKVSTKLIFKHIIEYQFNLNKLLSEYKKYIYIINNNKDLIKNSKEISNIKVTLFELSKNIYKSINLETSINTELASNYSNLNSLILNNIKGIYGILKDQKKYWYSRDIDFFMLTKLLKKYIN